MANLWQIVVVVVLAAVLLPAANIAYDEQSTATTTNETLTVDHGSTTAVSVDAAVYSSNVTVTQAGTELTAGSDYEWQTNFGAVYWPANSSAADGSSAEIEYTYHEAGEHTDGIATIIGSVGWLVWVLVFMTILGTLMAWIGLGSGGGW